MESTKSTPLSGIREGVASLGDDMREMLALRWKLARSELETDAASARRLAAALGFAGALVVAALPLASSAAAEWLDGRWGVSRPWWLVAFAAAYLVVGGLVASIAWWRFRRALVALRQSRAELQEDLAWLGEWLGR